MTKKEIIILVCSALLAVWLYHEVVFWLFRAWLNNPYYSHGLLLLPVSGGLILLERNEIYRAEPEDWHVLPLVVGLFLYLPGILLHQPVLLAFSLLPVLVGFSLVLLGKGAKPLIFPILLLATAIPSPFFESLELPLQNLSTVSLSVIFGFLGMPVSIDGHNVTLAGNTYWIAPACTGMNRIMPLFSLTAILAYLLHGSLLARVFLLALVFPLALASNIFRLFVTLLIGDWYGIEAAVSFFHDFSSIAFFLFAIALILIYVQGFKLHVFKQ
ncbi:exosortase/archaeosortase family protein [candidate division NPL-UPA2 bacterium]|nr:exosortase/archaeosortase family protein [candidate division NPL-UPA2 bacterium]